MKALKTHPLYIEDLRNAISVRGVERIKGKTFLITGATGLIGTHIIDALMTLDSVRIFAVGRSREKAFDRLGEYFDKPNFVFIEQDIMEHFPDDLNVDYILPCASNTHPLAYSQYPVETIMTNVKGAENALELAKKCGASVLYFSSVEVYGNAVGNDIFTENYTGKLNLSTSRACYTESKRVCEALCQSYISEYGVNVKIARLSRVFGPTMLPTDSKVSSQFINNALGNQDIVLKSSGNQYFSYTYVSDVVAALLHILLWGESGKAYNVSCENCNVHLKDFASLCAAYNGKKVVFDLPNEVEVKGYSIAVQAILDNGLLKSIGFTPKYSLENAVYRTIRILKGTQ